MTTKVKHPNFVSLLLLLALAACNPAPTATPVATVVRPLATPTVSAPPVVTATVVTVTATAPPLSPTAAQPTPTATPPAASATPLPSATATQPPLPSATATPPPTPEPPQGTVQRLQFAAGATEAMVENAVVRGTEDRYLVFAQAGQTMRVALTSLEDNAVFTLRAPNGTVLVNQTVAARQWEGRLPQTGDYVIIVAPTRGNATYQMVVTIPPQIAPAPTRINFAAGETTTAIDGELAAGATDWYVLRAVAEQTLSASLASPAEDVVLSVADAQGRLYLSREARQNGWYVAALPATQDYVLGVTATGGASDYTLYVSASPLADLPERITFAPGAVSATVTGTLEMGGDLQTYILRALGGQSIEIVGEPADAPLFIYLQSEDAEDFYYAEDGRLATQLPTTQDYIITVATPNAAGRVDFALTITIR